MASRRLGTSSDLSSVFSPRIYEVVRIDPIPVESRTDTRLFQMFFVWFSANINVLGCAATHVCKEVKLLRFSSLLLRLGTGAAGPAFFGLGVKQSLITLLVVDIMYVSAYTPCSIF